MHKNVETQRSLILKKEEEISVQSSNKSQAIARLLNRRMNKSKTENITSLSLANGITVEGDEQAANALNTFFSESFTTESNSTLYTSPTTLEIPLTMVVFTIENIKNAIRSLKHSNFPGPDGIPSSLLKQGGADIPLLLLKVFTLSLTSGVYPQIWKTSIIAPKRKRNNNNEISNFRPINITSVMSRLMEKVISAEISSHIHKNKLLVNSQHGFTKNRSTMSCQYDFLNHITTCRDTGHNVIIIYFDLCKAFDKVPHQRLIQKLKYFGIDNPLLTWISSFLHNRYQIVRVNNTYSKPTLITSGVVQGSVLGPLLFLLYINDISKEIKNGKCFLFADDLKVVYSSPRDIENTTSIQEDLARLETWSRQWLMPFSPSKCGVINLGSTEPPQLTFSGLPVRQLNNVTDLGVKYSPSLNFSEHARFIIAKARKMASFILRNFTTSEIRIALFNMCVRPILEYNCTLFSIFRNSDLEGIESVQRVFTRHLLIHNPHIPYNERCSQLRIQPLWLRRLKLNLTFVFKILNNLIHSENSQFSVSSSHSYNIRNKDNTLEITKHRTALRHNFITIRYSLLWNRLPPEIRTCSNLPFFKNLIDTYLDGPYLLALLNLKSEMPSDYTKGPPNI